MIVAGNELVSLAQRNQKLQAFLEILFFNSSCICTPLALPVKKIHARPKHSHTCHSPHVQADWLHFTSQPM